MTKHTPGPWHWDRKSNVGNLIVDAERNGVATFQSRHNLKWDDMQAEREANGALIAAAPDLLEALKGLREAVNFRDAASIAGDPDQVDAAVSMFMRADHDAQAAIAKAEAK